MEIGAVVNWGFWIALANILAALAGVFTPREKERIQEVLNSRTLRLSYYDVKTWYYALRQRRLRLALGVMTLFAAYIITFAATGVKIIAIMKARPMYVIGHGLLVLAGLEYGVGWLTRPELNTGLRRAGLLLSLTLLACLAGGLAISYWPGERRGLAIS